MRFQFRVRKPNQLSDPIQTTTKFMSWRFLDTIQADVLAGEFEDRKLRLIEHFRTQTTPDRPIRVLSVTTFADLKPLILALPDENPTVSIAITGYAQTKPSSKSRMTKWIPSATWDPVPGGLCSNGEFLSTLSVSNAESCLRFQHSRAIRLGEVVSNISY